MQWDKCLESDIPIIDHEHRELLNQLVRLMDESKPDRIRVMLTFLNEYVVKHFAHEQVLHKKSSYPKTVEHKAAHMDFLERVSLMEKQYDDEGDNLAMLQKIIETVSIWLKEHIMGQDREFADFYKGLAQNEKEWLGSFKYEP